MAQKDEENSRRKAFAVAVLMEIWAGALLPPSMVRHAQTVRREMLKNGTWASA